MLEGMYRINLSEAQREELTQRAHQNVISPSTRDRLEMVRLSDAGWSVPRIAGHLGPHEQTVRTWIKAFLEGGFEALYDQPRGGSTSALTAGILDAVHQEITQGERSWSASQLAQWIQEQFGVQRSTVQVRRKLREAQLSYKRTRRSLHHKQNPQEVAAKRAELEQLQKGALLES